MDEAAMRLAALIGEEALQRLKGSCVMVVGVGGVGSYAVEALARSFIGKLILVDADTVALSNLNRQLPALLETLGHPKVEVMKERIAKINPECEVLAIQTFYRREEVDCFQQPIDFVVDAIDTLTSKMDLIEECARRKIPMISALGMGNRLDPTQLVVTTLDKTSYDPLARALRQLARKRGFHSAIPVVFSRERPVQHQPIHAEGKTSKEKRPPSSSAFVPAAAGLAMASYVVRRLIESSGVPLVK